MADEIKTPALVYIQADNLPEGFLDAEAQAQAVNDALRRYSGDCPRILVESIAGADTSVYDLSEALAAWDPNASRVAHVEYPWSRTSENELDLDEWEVEEDPTAGKFLRLIGYSAATGCSIRVKYTALWTEATIPAHHLSPVAQLAAAGMARILAARFAQGNESTIQVDTFHPVNRSSQYVKLAQDLEKQYVAGVGPGGAGTGTVKPLAAACAVMPLDSGEKLIDYENEDWDYLNGDH